MVSLQTVHDLMNDVLRRSQHAVRECLIREIVSQIVITRYTTLQAALIGDLVSSSKIVELVECPIWVREL